jgi:hypothetical protein
MDKSNLNTNTQYTQHTQQNINSNIILTQNHQGAPCYNNINIYTNGLNSMKNNSTNGNGNINSNVNDETTLKNYISNKVNHRKSPSINKINTNVLTKQKININHSKSNSIIGKL